MDRVVGAGARLDRLPLSRFHWRMLGLIGAGALLDAFDINLGGSVLAAMNASGFSTVSLSATFFSATFLGTLLGGGLAGWVGDKKGRRYSYQFNLMLFGLASLATCFAPTINWVIALRFVMGIGLGAELVVAAGTMAEFIPPAYRGRWAAMLGTVVASGLPISTALSYFVIPAFGWRAMFAVAGIGALVVWAMRKSMPESPRWLEAVGRYDEAEAELAAIEASVVGEHGPLPPPATSTHVPSRSFSAAQLFRKPLIGRTSVAIIIQITNNVAVYGLVAWLPTFLIKQGMTVVQSLGYSALMSLGATLGGVIGIMVADRLGRKTSLMAACAAVAAFGFIYPLAQSSAEITASGFGLICSIYLLATLGLYTYIPELFPTEIRLRGTGTAAVCGRVASILMPYATAYLFQSYGLQGVLAAVFTALALLIIAVLVLHLETGSRALEEIVEENA